MLAGLDHLLEGAGRLIAVEALEGERTVPENQGEQVVEVMGNPGARLPTASIFCA